MKHLLSEYLDFQKNLFSIFFRSYRHMHRLFWGKIIIVFQIFGVIIGPLILAVFFWFSFGDTYQWNTVLTNIPLLLFCGGLALVGILFLITFIWYLGSAAPVYLFYRLQNPDALRDMSIWNWSKFCTATALSARTSLVLLFQFLLLFVLFGGILLLFRINGIDFMGPVLGIGMVIGGLITVRWGLNYFFVLPGFFLDWGDGTYSNTGIIQLSKKTVAGKKLKLLGVLLPITLMLLCIEGAHIFIQNKHEEWRLTRIIQEQYQFQTGAKVEPTEFLLSLYTPEIQQVLEMKEMENHEALSQYIKDIPPEITTSINTELISRVYHLLDVRSLDPNWQWIQLLYWFGMYLISGFSIFGIQVALFQLKDHKYFKPKVYVSPQEWHG